MGCKNTTAFFIDERSMTIGHVDFLAVSINNQLNKLAGCAH